MPPHAMQKAHKISSNGHEHGTEDQLPVLADQTKPPLSLSIDNLHNLLQRLPHHLHPLINHPFWNPHVHVHPPPPLLPPRPRRVYTHPIDPILPSRPPFISLALRSILPPINPPAPFVLPNPIPLFPICPSPSPGFNSILLLAPRFTCTVPPRLPDHNAHAVPERRTLTGAQQVEDEETDVVSPAGALQLVREDGLDGVDGGGAEEVGVDGGAEGGGEGLGC